MANVIKKNNAVNDAHFSLSVAEYRVILMAIYIARVKSLDPLTERIRFHANEFIEAFGFKGNNSNHHTALIDATLSLKSKMLIMELPDHILKNKIKTTYANWTSEVSYIGRTGYVEIMFSQRVAEALIEDSARYTLYDLQLLSKLSSFYAIRIFEYVMQWRTVGKTQFYPIENLKKRLGIGLTFPTPTGMSEPDLKYAENKLFNRDVIGRAVALINKVTDLDLQYETVKVGKSVTGGSFRFNKDANAIVRTKEAKKLLAEEQQRKDRREKDDQAHDDEENLLF